MVYLSVRVVLTVIMLASWSIALAGCVGSDDVEPEGDDLSDPALAVVSDTTGSIKGTVASALFEPLAGAEIGIVETAATTRANRVGEFVFNDVEPGRYTLLVNALGYASAKRAVDVKAGEISGVQFLLDKLALDEPWVEPQGPYVGKITYAYSHQVELPVLGCMVIETPVRTIKNCGGARGGDSPNGEIAIAVTDDVKTILVEMVWDPAGPLGEYLAIDVLCSEVPRGGEDGDGAVLEPEHVCYFGSENEDSPIVHRVDEAHWLEHGYNYTGNWAARVFSTYGMLGTYAATGIDAGVAYEQSFTIYVSVFHKEPAPEGFTGVPDL